MSSFTENLTLNPSLVHNKQECVKILPIGTVNCFEFQNLPTNNQIINESFEEESSLNNNESTIYKLSPKAVLDNSPKPNNFYGTSKINTNHELNFDPSNEIICDEEMFLDEGSLLTNLCQVKMILL